MHLALGWAGIMAANPALDWADLERLHGPAVAALAAVGRNFIMRSVGSLAQDSDVTSEATPESSEPTAPISSPTPPSSTS
jgi:hypothetical protein